MELMPERFYNLGLPPSLVTCTRDTFSDQTSFTLTDIIKITHSMADALQHLHKNGVSHGDIYAHNTMIDNEANMLFGDFGAASNLTEIPKHQQSGMQAVEVRAFGCLLDDLLSLCQCSNNTEKYQKLSNITKSCLQDSTLKRPSFMEITKQLKKVLN